MTGSRCELVTNAEGLAIASSLVALCALLVVLVVKDIRGYLATRALMQLAWGLGVGLAAMAMAVEAVVYLGVVTASLLQLYVFLSAAIVGVLSLGAVHVLRNPRVRRAYASYQVAAMAVVAVASFTTSVPAGMVKGGIISGNPTVLLLLLSSCVTVPATAVLLLASAIALLRSRRWQMLLLISGALILGAGGALYVASFPVALYYAEFAGIILLFFGVVNLPRPAPAVRAQPHPEA